MTLAKVARLDARAQALDRCAGKRLAGDHHFEPVVIRRIVAAGHGDRTLRAELERGEVGDRRRDAPDVDHAAAARGNAIGQGMGELRTGQPSVASDHDLIALTFQREAAQRLADIAHDRGRQRPADDASDVVGLEDFRGE